MDWLSWKYVNLLGPQLPNFKVRNNLICCSCPFCDEIHTSHKKRPMRGYILDGRETGVYFCHRCSISMSVPNLIRRLDSNLYADYIKEKFSERGGHGIDRCASVFQTEEVGALPTVRSSEKTNLALRTVKKISRLPKDHFCCEYIRSRLIPEELYKLLYFTPKFMTWINTIIPDKFSEEALEYDEPRLVIPFLSRAGKLTAVQGRSFKSSSKVKYLTIAIDQKCAGNLWIRSI